MYKISKILPDIAKGALFVIFSRFAEIFYIISKDVKLIKYMSNDSLETTTKLIKTIVIGKVSVGKSSLILKYVNRDNSQPQTTVGMDILLRKV